MTKAALLYFCCASLALGLAALGVHRGTWPSLVQVLSLAILFATVSLAVGWAATGKTTSVARWPAAIAVTLASWLFVESADPYYSFSALMWHRLALLGASAASSFVVVSLAKLTGLQIRTSMPSTSEKREQLQFTLQHMFVALTLLTVLFGLKYLCPNEPPLSLPLMPFYWPIGCCFSIASLLGAIAALTSTRAVSHVAMTALGAAIVGIFPAYYLDINSFEMWIGWPLQMTTTFVVSSLMMLPIRLSHVQISLTNDQRA